MLLKGQQALVEALGLTWSNQLATKLLGIRYVLQTFLDPQDTSHASTAIDSKPPLQQPCSRKVGMLRPYQTPLPQKLFKFNPWDVWLQISKEPWNAQETLLDLEFRAQNKILPNPVYSGKRLQKLHLVAFKTPANSFVDPFSTSYQVTIATCQLRAGSSHGKLALHEWNLSTNCELVNLRWSLKTFLKPKMERTEGFWPFTFSPSRQSKSHFNVPSSLAPFARSMSLSAQWRSQLGFSLRQTRSSFLHTAFHKMYCAFESLQFQWHTKSQRKKRSHFCPWPRFSSQNPYCTPVSILFQSVK